MKKIELLESALLKKAGLGTFAKKIEELHYSYKNYKIVAFHFETDAVVKKYWLNEIYKNGVLITKWNSFEEKKDLKILKFELFEIIKIESGGENGKS